MSRGLGDVYKRQVNNLREYLSILSRQDGYETALIDKGDGITVTRKKK